MEDAAAAGGMGTACLRVPERVAASLGSSTGAMVHFERCLDVPNAGVLCAIPALLGNGLLDGIEKLGLLKGFYTVFQLLLLFALMLLCRIKNVEQLRGYEPGEWGKLLGLDRIPEARCLRKKMDALSADEAAAEWSAHLSHLWMEQEPDAVGSLYIDGHVSVYYGHATKLPRRYVSRQRLCLRGTTGYWVNDAIGRPFFVVEKVVNHGLLQVLEEEIIPRLLQDVPQQPTAQQLEDNPYLCRFLLVFDREGYSPAFFGRMWQEHRIACITYHKFPGADWERDCFSDYEVPMPGGALLQMQLSERGSFVGTGKDALWLREIRKLNDNGHQSSLLTTAYEWPLPQIAAQLFSRWSQENFFRYLMQHFALDQVVQYGTMGMPETELVVNPEWRVLEKTKLSLQNKLRSRRATFAQLTMHPKEEQESKNYTNWQKKKEKVEKEAKEYESQLATVKEQQKEQPKHIKWSQLEEKKQWKRLPPQRKYLMDTIRMIAYRAETAMAQKLTTETVDLPDARRLLQNLFTNEADLLPEPENNLLRVRVHNASSPAANRSLLRLFEFLNQTETIYPDTNMRLYYELRGTTDSDP